MKATDLYVKATDLYALGFGKALISVIPPDAALTPNSTIDPDSRGKAPGLLYPSGWGGYNWRSSTPSIEDAMRMDESGANVGLAAANFCAIDVDVLDASLSKAICDLIEDLIPTGPVRIGLAPKRLYVFRTEVPFTRMQLVMEYQGRQLVEVLGSGQQYVISGVHAKTKKPYTWPVPLCPAAELPLLTKETADTVLRAIATLVCDFLDIPYHRAGTGDPRSVAVQGDLLCSDIVELASAVLLIPNTAERFPTRADYIRVGYAIKAATAEHPGEGEEIFTEWALRYEGNTPEQIETDWNSFEGPYEIGAEFVFETAREFGYNTAMLDFEATAEDLPPPAPAPQKAEVTKALSPYSDMWLADKLVDEFGEVIVFQPERGKFLAYESGIWNEDLRGTVPGQAKEICLKSSHEVLHHGATDKEKKEAVALSKSLASARQHSSILNLARQDSRVIVLQEKFDVDHMLLGTPNGIVDLDTGKVFPSRPELYISRSTPVAPGPPSKLWNDFLEEATEGDIEYREYLQRVAGYCLTGSTISEILFFIRGEGGRGKSTFVDTISLVLGNYAKTSQMSTFTAKKVEKHTTELAMLAGARLVTAQEVNEGSYWDEARIKALTGGDSVTARFLNQDNFTYKPTFKLMFSGNARPKIASVDSALRRRIHLLPFNAIPKTINTRLKEQLKNEALPGVLSWMIEGALKWKEIGFGAGTIPKKVLESTAAYLRGEDPQGRWIDACCDEEGESRVQDLHGSWVDWCEKHGETPWILRKFVSSLINRGKGEGKDLDGSMTLIGLRLKQKPLKPGEEFVAEEAVTVQ